MRKFAIALYAAALLVALAGSTALAQTEDPCKNPTYKQCYEGLPVRTLAIDNAREPADANSIVAAIRNILPPESKIFMVNGENAIVVRAMPDDIALAQKLISELDKPKKTYRLAYTVTEVDGAKKIGSQRFAIVLTDAQKTSLNQGNRVPVATGSYSADHGAAQTQYTYVDVGTNFEATLYATGTGARLNSKVTQSSFVAPTSSDGPQQPIVRNLTLEGSSMLVPGKPVALGYMDVPGSTRHLDVEVVMENLP
jgi:type II secretory pathway component GspD/PulD (secretin)